MPPDNRFFIGGNICLSTLLEAIFLSYGIENLILSIMFILLCVYCSLMKIVVTENLERKYSDPENLLYNIIFFFSILKVSMQITYSCAVLEPN